MNEKTLLSKSGDEIFFKTNSKGMYVQKRQTFNSGTRLNAQAVKQQNFDDLISSDESLKHLFHVPKIKSASLIEKSFSFDMEYCHGDNIIDLFEKRGVSKINRICDSIHYFLDWEFSRSKLSNSWFVPTMKKVESLKTQIDSNIFDKNSLDILMDLLVLFKDKEVHEGLCHGDLTLSNMLFTDKAVLFDFLPVYFETPYQDIAKLLQEVQLKWTYLILHNVTDKAKVEIAYIFLRKKINEIIQEIVEKYRIDYILVLIFYSIAIIRILPYVDTPHIVVLIQEENEKTIQQICEAINA